MSCAFIDVAGGSMAIQTEHPHGIDGYVSLVPLGTHAIGYSTAPTVIKSNHHPGQIIIQTNENNQSSLAFSTSEPLQQIQAVENQQQTLLLVSTNPDDISGQFTLNQEIKNPQQVQMQQQVVLLTDMQGSSQGAIIQMPSVTSVIHVPGVISTGDQTATYIGTIQPNSMAVESSNTLYVTNPGGGDIILCIQPGEITTLEVPSNLVVESSNACFTTAAIDSQMEEVSKSDLARSWQADSDLVNRALTALSSQSSPVLSSTRNVSLVESVNSPMAHLCPHAPSLHQIEI